MSDFEQKHLEALNALRDETKKLSPEQKSEINKLLDSQEEKNQAKLRELNEKSKKIEDDSKLLARWNLIERSLEEIFYHYEIIYEYQKTLSEKWRNRIPVNPGGAPGNIDLVISILTYNDSIKEIDKEIADQ